MSDPARPARRGRRRLGPLPRGELRARGGGRASPTPARVPSAGPAPDLAETEEVAGHLPDAGDAAGAAALAPVPAPVAATVTFARSGCEVACAAGTTVLAAAEQAGIPLPSSCGDGMCGTCKSALLAGQVDMNHHGGIRPREIAAGKFLPCCSTPDGDIVVDA